MISTTSGNDRATKIRGGVRVGFESTTSLDVTVAAAILKELKRLWIECNMGLILIFHDLAMISETCDRTCCCYPP
jgi:peptide/nickel transport system ATP-binding protein